MILYVAIAGLIASAGTGYLGYQLGQDSKEAEIARTNKAIDDTYAKALEGASQAISKIEVKNVTINRQLETKVRTERVFADCRSGPDSVRLYNEGIEGAQQSSDRSKLPATDTAPR